MTSARAELVQIQKKLYLNNRRRIRDSIQVEDPEFLAYERRYTAAVGKYQKVVRIDDMIQQSLGSDLIYVGDYHTCHQSQRSFLRILKALRHSSTRPLLLCLELFHHSMQSVLDHYMSGRLSEEAFLRKVKLNERWVFDLWANFKPILDFARYHKLKVVGIEVAKDGASLPKRDRATGAYLAELTQQYPDHQLVILIGDLHLAPSHLPAEVQAVLRKQKITRSQTILYENSEPIYWQLAKRGLVEKVDVVQLKANAFCIMHTPPLVCQQSYLNWLEHEEGEIDFADARHSFLDLVDRIAQYLRLPVGPEKEAIEVYTCGDLSFLKRLEKDKAFGKKDLALIKDQVLASESYFIPKIPLVYLANLSLNHAAEEASHYLKFLCTGAEEPREVVDAFYANTLHEALGFFGSKLINPKRKCFHPNEFRALLRYFSRHPIPEERSLELHTAQLLMAYLQLERQGKAMSAVFVFDQPHMVFFAITHALGYMLGDRLFYGLMSNVIRKSQLRELFTDGWKKAGAPYRTYMRLQKLLESVKIPKRM